MKYVKPTIVVKVENVFSYAHITNQKFAQLAINDMSFFVDNYKYTKAYKNGSWDGKIRFARYNPPKLRFYTGLLKRFAKLCNKNGFDLQIVDNRTMPKECIDIEVASERRLRDYQEEAINKIIKAQRGIVQSPTGSGKTEIFMHLIARLKLPTLILTHTQDLMFQTANRCMDTLNLDEIGIIGAGAWEPSDKVTVALFQSLATMFKENKKQFLSIVSKYPLLIVDEAHHVNYNAKTFSKIVEAIPATYRYAFTATPKRHKSETATDMQLVALFGPKIVEIQKDMLISKGYLTPYKLHIVHYPLLQEYPTKREYLEMYALDANGEMSKPQVAYRQAFNDCIINNESRLKAIGWILRQHANDSLLISCHSEELCSTIATAFNIPEITGNPSRFSKDDRARVYKEFREGNIKHLVATNIYSEGIDFPKLKVIVLAEPFKSNILLLQKVGRTMRRAQGKTIGIVYDFADTDIPFFDTQYKHRLKVYEEEGVEIKHIHLKEVDLLW